MKIGKLFLIVGLTRVSSSQQKRDDSSVEVIIVELNNLSLSPQGMVSLSEQAANITTLLHHDDSTVESSLTCQPERTVTKYEIPMDLREKVEYADLDGVESILAMIKKASMEQKANIMMASNFYFANDEIITAAMAMKHENYLEYLVMAEYVDFNENGEEEIRSVALKKRLTSKVDILLGHVYGKPWCLPETWNRLVFQFGIRLSEWTSDALILNVLQGRKSIPNAIRNKLKAGLNGNQLLEYMALYDRVEIFKLLYERKEIELELNPIIYHKSMKILKFLSSEKICLPDRWKLSSHYLDALTKAIGINDHGLIRYLLPYNNGNKRIAFLSGYVTLETLKLLFTSREKSIFKDSIFKNVDLEGIEFLNSLDLDTFAGSWSLLKAIIERGDPKLSKWALDNWDHPKHEKGWTCDWDEFVVKAFDFVKDLYKYCNFVPPAPALVAPYKDGRLDIVEWWHGVESQAIIASFKSIIMKATEPVLEWILQNYQDQLEISPWLLNESLHLGLYRFVNWAERNGLGLPDDSNWWTEQDPHIGALGWLKSRDIIPSLDQIKQKIASGNFHVLKRIMRYPELDPGEEFIDNLGNDPNHAQANWASYKAYYYRIKNGDRDEDPRG